MTGFLATIIPEKRLLLDDLTPAPGRRTQTISPYASAALVSRCLTSTAPCPSFATMAYAPLAGQDVGFLRCVYLTVEAEYFSREDWTDFW